MSRPAAKLKPLTQRQRALVSEHVRLAYKAAFKFHNTVMGRRLGTLEDCEQEAILGLIRAAQGFDESRGFRFSTYACTVIPQRLMQAAKQLGVVKIPTSYDGTQPLGQAATIISSLDEPIDGFEDGNLTIGGTIGARPEHEDGATRVMNREVADAMRWLPFRERRILELRSQGETLTKIGERYSLSKERIRQIERRGLNRLREKLSA